MRTLLILFAVGLFLVVGCQQVAELKECETDADCVPASCCHPDSCVAAVNAPECRDTFCTQECQPGSLDCGQGKCACQEGKCGVRWIGQ